MLAFLLIVVLVIFAWVAEGWAISMVWEDFCISMLLVALGGFLMAVTATLLLIQDGVEMFAP